MKPGNSSQLEQTEEKEETEETETDAEQGSSSGYSCDVCDETFAHKSSLSRHKTVHKDNKSWVCSSCDKKFSRNDALNRHIESSKCKGREIKKFVCPKCGRHQLRK